MDSSAITDKAMAEDAAIWAVDNKIKISGEVFSFKDHEYQIDPLSMRHQRTCDMKGTQGGFTLIFVFLTLHGMIHCYYKQGVLYLFPTNDDVSDFSKSRFQPLISTNRNAIGKFVKSTDAANLKKVGNGYLYLRGARLSQLVKDEHKESSKLRSIPVDCIIFDEYDLMDEDVREKAFGRMGHSKVQEEHFLSNPTVPDYGIAKLFYEESDQRHWFRKCRCGQWTSAEMSFPECVKIRKDSTGYIGCNTCGSELKIFPGEWVPACPDMTSNMVGRRWSQLTSIFHDPARILDAYNNPRDGNLGDVYRLKLGLPYIAAEDRLRQSEFLACCGGRESPHTHNGPCAMGVDVGRTKHVIIGARTGKDRYEIYKRIKLSSWPEIHLLAERMGVRSAVIDIRPYEDSARDFQAKAKYKVWLCEYKESTPQGTNYNQHTGIVAVNRTEICDATHRLVVNGKLTIPMLSDNMKSMAKEVCAMYKVLEENKKTKVSIYRYRNAGEDHDRHALNYFLLACNKLGIVDNQVKNRKPRQTVANNNYARV